MKKSTQIRRHLVAAFIALLCAFIAAAGATFAWYIYNTGAHTTNIHMAAGTSVQLQISDKYDGKYSSAAVLDSFDGELVPVSTDSILGGFQKVEEFIRNKEWKNEKSTVPQLLAHLFGEADEEEDYFMTSLYLRTNSPSLPIYLADIGYEDDDDDNPISTAIRIGFVVHAPGKSGAAREEFIFEINDEENPEREYNTETGEEGYVLDSAETDGSTVEFEPYTSDNFCIYDKNTGETRLNRDSQVICTLAGGSAGGYGEPVRIDVYIWLEGCDPDCTGNLSGASLENISLQFAGYQS